MSMAKIDLERQIRTRRAHYRPVGGGTPVSVKVDRDVSDFWTLVEVGGPDRMGLLFDIAWTLSALGLDVHSAKVATYGPRVVDVFYVTEATGQKVQAERASEVKAALEQALTDR